jgi:hypothetical protein
LMLTTMIGLECLRRGSSSNSRSDGKPATIEELVGGRAFGPCAPAYTCRPEPETPATPPTNNGQILIGTGKGNPVVSDLAGTPNQVVITKGAGSITIETNQGTLGPSPGQETKTTNDVSFSGVKRCKI